jgi:hypothetical protein
MIDDADFSDDDADTFGDAGSIARFTTSSR